ncbi:MAG TPA: zf-HC2 domain-containing protein [Thermoanaerobaculia bacterium]|nr:zf-HC2 domain-containing protein [Thermoanaerobaculia bacterium]
MNCPEILERLPWYLNGTLDPREKDEVTSHLASCAECRRELEELRLAAEIYRAEMPPAAVIDHVLGTRDSGLDPELVARLVGSTPRYQEEVALLRRSLADSATDAGGLAAGGRVLTGRFARKVEVPRWLPIAASIAGLLLPALLVWNLALRSDLASTVAEKGAVESSLVEARAEEARISALLEATRKTAATDPTDRERLEQLEAELEEKSRRVTELEQRVKRPEGAFLMAAVELSPQPPETVVRGTGETAPAIEQVTRTGRTVRLSLYLENLDLGLEDRLRVSILDASGRRTVVGEINRAKAEEIELGLPTADYPAGVLTIEIASVAADGTVRTAGSTQIELVDPR